MFNVNDFDLTRTQWEDLIDQHIFNERARKLIKRRLLDGIHYEPLAEEFEQMLKEDIFIKNKL